MLNKVILIGRLGKDPITRRFSETNMVAEFTLATSERYRDKEGNLQTITDWHNIKINLPRLAETAEKYLKKGMKVYIEGKLRTREYEKDGQKRNITEVIAENFLMLDKKEEDTVTTVAAEPAISEAEKENAAATTYEDDLPF
ncbi:MAG: single-stranded DNA-binding protein [Chitinophagales bacterium]|nr:single-stranded DNA-binding protein [Chitinophagales bacterium]MDW8272949.1 single-stranded DNA-binding protein [Chitinophagales bacterium]